MENATEQSYDPTILKDQPWPIAIKYGLIGAAVLMVIMLIKQAAGMMDLSNAIEEAQSGSINFGKLGLDYFFRFTAVAAYTIIYFLAIKEYRTQLGGMITFGNAYKLGFFSIVIKAVVLFIWAFLFYSFICPIFCESYQQLMEEAVSQGGRGGNNEGLDMFLGIVNNAYSPFGLSIFLFFKTFIGGALLVLIAAAIAQKE